jgi:hypothetical protein
LGSVLGESFAVIITQCFDECWDCARVAQHAENLRGKFAFVFAGIFYIAPD